MLQLDSTLVQAESKWSKRVSVGLLSGYLARQRNDRNPVLNTGYTRMFVVLGAGVGYKKRIRLNVFADLPFYERLSGAQNSTKFRIRTSLLININKEKK